MACCKMRNRGGGGEFQFIGAGTFPGGIRMGKAKKQKNKWGKKRETIKETFFRRYRHLESSTT